MDRTCLLSAQSHEAIIKNNSHAGLLKLQKFGTGSCKLLSKGIKFRVNKKNSFGYLYNISGEWNMTKNNGKKRILIIDDDIVTREIIKEALETRGYVLEEASNGRIGVALHKKKPFDLIITDIIMPEMEGLETILAVKNISPGIKIIAISGGGRVDAYDYLYMADKFGAHRVITKPFEQQEIVDTVAELLKKP